MPSKYKAMNDASRVAAEILSGESELTRRAREVLAGLTKPQRSIIAVAGCRVRAADVEAPDWIPGGRSYRSLAALRAVGLIEQVGQLRNRTDLGREVARLIAEGT